MSRPVIKLYPPKSCLSDISDEIIDSRKAPNLFFEFREAILLNSGSIYQILISNGREIKGQYEFQYLNTNLVEIKIFNENQLLSRTSRNPFTIKLVDQNNQTIGLGSFYRYRTSASVRSMNPANWDPKFNPLEHTNYSVNKNDSYIFSESQKKLKAPNFFPTPERSDSDISLNSIESLKYSSISQRNTMSHSTPTSSCVFMSVKRLNFSQPKIYLNQKPKNLIPKKALENVGSLTDDSSDDDDYSFANRTNLTSHFDSQSQISSKSKTYLELFDSIESVSENEFQTKNKEDFLSFTLLLSCSNSEPNSIKIKNNVFISNSDKTFRSNHAIRKLREIYNVRLVANFKVEINITKDKKFETELKDLLIDGIQMEINGEREKFYFIGSSNSGIREKNFWAIDEKSFHNIDFESFLLKMGNFDQFYSIAKLNKRYSQFFSTSKPTIVLKKTEFYVIKDEFSHENLCFTDGIGLIRLELCEKISKLLAIDFNCMIFQVRCGGFKGMLVGFPDNVFNSVIQANNLPLNNEIKVLFRKSQKKFDSNSLELNIVSWSNFECSPVSLNSEFLMVLDGLSKTPDLKNYIISLFQNYLNDIEDSLINPQKAFYKIFNNCGELNEFSHKFKMMVLACRKNLVEELDPQQYKIIRNLLIDQYLYSLITKKKFNVQIEKSRYLIGVLDETNILNQDEVFISYRDNSGKIQYLNEQFCIVARNPCYNLSEIRKVRAIFVPELKHLENCIVFPKKGKRPLTNILSGGDLDGDFYFVSWDEILTEIENSNTLIDYPEGQDFSSDVKINNLRNQLAEFYAKQVINENGIGLWHFYLTSLYDEDRNNMLEKQYIDGVLEINKCIDGVRSENQKTKIVKKPFWYLTTQEVNSLVSMNREEKFRALAEILNRHSINLDKVEQNTHRYSLLGCLATIAIKKFLSLVSKLDNSINGQFLNDYEIQILIKNKKINLNICQESIRSENLNLIKQEYRMLISEITKLENKFKSESSRELKLYTGMYEKQAINEAISRKEQLKINLINKFRKFVVNLKYSEKDLTDENYKNSVYCLDGFYFRSRLVSLYLDLKNEKVNYQIPWMFYDVLCYLKNYCNDNQSCKAFIALGDLTPFSMPSEYINSFSAKRLSNFNNF